MTKVKPLAVNAVKGNLFLVVARPMMFRLSGWLCISLLEVYPVALLSEFGVIGAWSKWANEVQLQFEWRVFAGDPKGAESRRF